MPLPYSTIEQAAKLTSSVIVGFSCGKDSLVTLDLACKHFKTVYAYFMYLIPGLEVMEETMRWAEVKYGLQIMRVPHVNVSLYIKDAIYRPMSAKAMQCPKLEYSEVEHAVSEHFRCPWFCYGHRMQESLQRRGMINANGRIDFKHRVIYPIADWVPKMVYAYIRNNSIPLPRIYRELGKSFGLLRPDLVYYLKQNYPEDFAKVKQRFPYIEAAAMRYELQQRYAK